MELLVRVSGKDQEPVLLVKSWTLEQTLPTPLPRTLCYTDFTAEGSVQAFLLQNLRQTDRQTDTNRCGYTHTHMDSHMLTCTHWHTHTHSEWTERWWDPTHMFQHSWKEGHKWIMHTWIVRIPLAVVLCLTICIVCYDLLYIL
jgi:hypothetical protein